jgi:pimeloyl-ACP methyl ester carboxylesterase
MELIQKRIEVEPGVSLATWIIQGRDSPGKQDANQAGATILFVHGLASNAKLWDVTSLELASRGHTVAAVDLRGHGQSDKPDSSYDFGTLVADVEKVRDVLGLERPILAGQSMGANLVLDVAWLDPESSSGIVCVDGGTIELGQQFPDWAEVAKALAPPELVGTPEATMRRILRQSHPTWPETGIESTMANFEIRDDATIAPRLSRQNHMQILRSLWEDRPSTKFSTLRVPALFVFAGGGISGSPNKRGGGEDAASGVPIVEVSWFEDADHDVHAQYPIELADLIDSRVRNGFFGARRSVAAD